MKIFLIRHGQTDWNVQGRIQGQKDIALNEAGEQQARLLAEGMQSRRVTQIYCSRQKRAIQTAAAIGSRQQVEVHIVEGLEEVNFGYWEGMTMEEIQKNYPKEYENWCVNPLEARPPGGETQMQVLERASKVVDEILAQAKGDLAIVSHGATLAYIAAYLLKDNQDEKDIIVENASITTLLSQGDKGSFVLLQSNDVRHLQSI